MRNKWSLIIVAALAFTFASFAASVASAAVNAGRQSVQKKRVAFGLEASALAKHFLGMRYLWGGSSPRTGFDCSGLTMFVYGQLGIRLPHNAAAQYSYGRSVSRSALKPGDLIFFRGLGHVGMYVGGGKFIHSPRTGERIRIEALSGHWAGRYYGARRVTV